MSEVIQIEDFKGRKTLKEYYKDFIYCPKCLGILHWEQSPHLTEKQLKEAITFPRYVVNGHPYYLSEHVMIDFARHEGIVR